MGCRNSCKAHDLARSKTDFKIRSQDCYDVIQILQKKKTAYGSD